MTFHIYQFQNCCYDLRYLHFEPGLKLRWWRARDFDGSQIAVSTGGVELRTSCVQWKVQTSQFKLSCGHWNLWSIQNLEHDAIAVSNLGRSWSISTQINYSCRKACSSNPPAKPLRGSKVDLAYHPSRADQMSTRNSWGLSSKKQTVSS